MNAQQLASARAHINELKYGMSNYDVKRLDLRQFCMHTERMRHRIRTSLYKLTPEWLQYVEEHGIINAESEDEVIDKIKVSEDSRFSTFVQEISSIKSVASESNPVLSDIEHAIITGDCQTENVFDRATLIYRYYEQLKTTGMTDFDIVRADLAGMLGEYLVLIGDKYKLKSNACLYILHVINKYYRKDIDEYRRFIYSIYLELKSKYQYKTLDNIPVHLFKTMKRWNDISTEITYEVFWECAKSIPRRSPSERLQLLSTAGSRTA